MTVIAECISERRRTQGGRVTVEVWHMVAGPPDADVTWRPIRCGGGINLPGNSTVRVPTCAECVAAAASPSHLPEEGDHA